jgi:hypothetical protein
MKACTANKAKCFVWVTSTAILAIELLDSLALTAKQGSKGLLLAQCSVGLLVECLSIFNLVKTMLYTRIATRAGEVCRRQHQMTAFKWNP